MEINKRLVMTFKTTDDKKVSLSVDDPREYITESEIKSAMDLVVAKNIFAPNGADIASIVEAKVVVTDTTPYDLELKNSLRLSDVSAKHFMSPTTSSVAQNLFYAQKQFINITYIQKLSIFLKYYNILKRKKVYFTKAMSIFLA